MYARIHQGLAWIFVAALAGAAGCSASDGSGQPAAGKPEPGSTEPGTTEPGTTEPGKTGKPAPGKRVPGRTGPGRELPGGTPADCFGPSALSTAAREQLATQVCAVDEHPVSSGGACASAYQVRSDAEIAGLLSAWNNAVIRDSTEAARDGADSATRDVAHLLAVTHTHARDEQGALFTRLKIQPERTAGSQALDGGYQAECEAVAPSTPSGREYVARQIEAEQRALRLVDALIPQARNADLRCALQVSRAVTEAQIDHACWVWSSMSAGHVGEARSPEVGGDTDGGEP